MYGRLPEHNSRRRHDTLHIHTAFIAAHRLEVSDSAEILLDSGYYERPNVLSPVTQEEGSGQKDASEE